MDSTVSSRRVSVDITKHIRTFINPNNGREITREELKTLSRGGKLAEEISEQGGTTEETGRGEAEIKVQ